MKRRDLIKHICKHGCVLVREGGKFSLYKNATDDLEIPVTRHPEIAEFAARKICKSLGIPKI